MRPKTYWHILKNSLSSSAYYLEIIQSSFILSIRFFLISMFLLGLTWALRVNSRLLPQLQEQSTQILTEIESNFPENLEIKWGDQQLSIYPNEVLKISYPQNFQPDSQFPAQLANISPVNLEPDQFKNQLQQQSLFVITPEKIYINNLQDSWTQTPLVDLLPSETTLINKSNLPSILKRTESHILNLFKMAQKIIFLILPIWIVMVMLWTGLIESIFIYLFFKLNRISLSYKKTFQLSLHLIVVAETINQAANWIYPHLRLPMLSFSFWILLIYVFLTQKNNFLKLM